MNFYKTDHNVRIKVEYFKQNTFMHHLVFSTLSFIPRERLLVKKIDRWRLSIFNSRLITTPLPLDVDKRGKEAPPPYKIFNVM